MSDFKLKLVEDPDEPGEYLELFIIALSPYFFSASIECAFISHTFESATIFLHFSMV